MSSNTKQIFLKRNLILNGVLDLPTTEQKRENIEKYIMEHIGGDLSHCEELIHFFWLEFQRRWHRAQRKKERFFLENAVWLEEYVVFGKPTSSEPNTNVGGRPSKEFDETSDRNKRRRTETLRIEHSPGELIFAAQVNFRQEGNASAASSLKKIGSSRRLSDEAALAVFVDAKLTKRTYEIIKGPCTDVYPPYKCISAAKLKCYPPSESIHVSETQCKVELQALLNHTCTRLMDQLNPDTLTNLARNGLTDLRLILKWGCDGSSGLHEFKQKFSNPGSSDANVFLTSLVPLRLVGNDEVIWDNPRPSSTRYCRPINLQLIKETTDVTVEEYTKMSEQIEKLLPLVYQIDKYEIKISFELALTMVDGKVVNAITGTTSAQRCYLCGATISQFNDIPKIKNKPINIENLEFGISSLHCWIRSFECLIHIAYRLEFRKWSKAGHEEEFQMSKSRIQREFFSQLGLHVDKPRTGAGNSNDGNTARRFFKNADIAAKITGIDENLINMLRNILIAISSGEEIDPIEYKKYAHETAELYVANYAWYHMPTTLHKLLLHGHEIIDKAVLPIGCLSEEAQEAINKEIRRLRSDHSRKNSRENTMLDIFHGLLVASDPIVSSFRHGKTGKRENLPEEVHVLLKTYTEEETE